MKASVVFALALAVLGLTPSPAFAERLATPFAGVTFGGDTTASHPLFGAVITVLGKKTGIEIELSGAPGFFEAAGESHSILMVMGRIVIGGKTLGRGIKPFLSIGGGFTHARVDNSLLFTDPEIYDLTLDFGGGAYWFFAANVGVRGEARYTQKIGSRDEFLNVSGNLGFWRTTAGVSFLF